MNEVLELIAEVCADGRIVKRNPNVNLFDTGLLDSMSYLELLTTIEEEFDIEIDPADATKAKLGTPKAICDYVESRIRK